MTASAQKRAPDALRSASLPAGRQTADTATASSPRSEPWQPSLRRSRCRHRRGANRMVATEKWQPPTTTGKGEERQEARSACDRKMAGTGYILPVLGVKRELAQR